MSIFIPILYYGLVVSPLFVSPDETVFSLLNNVSDAIQVREPFLINFLNRKLYLSTTFVYPTEYDPFWVKETGELLIEDTNLYAIDIVDEPNIVRDYIKYSGVDPKIYQSNFDCDRNWIPNEDNLRDFQLILSV